MPTEYEDEPEKDEEEKYSKYFENLDDLRVSFPEMTPAEKAEIIARVNVGWRMSKIRRAELEAVVEKWLDQFMRERADVNIPRSKEKMLELLTEVILPSCRLFGLFNDADLEQKITPDETAVEFLLHYAEDYLYGDETIDTE